LSHPAQLEAMTDAMHRFARPKAADEIAALAELHARD
jgi:UDP-N-acetylglucosamine:LPS N-acetylglucosamine transferase